MAERNAGRLQDVYRKSRWREEDARWVVGAWQRSGESISSFARRRGLHPYRLSRWAARLQQGGRPLQFHPVRIVQDDGKDRREAIEVVLVDGRRVRVPSGFATVDLERVLAVLEGRS